MQTLERAEKRDVVKGQVWFCELQHAPEDGLPETWVVVVRRAGVTKPARFPFTERKYNYGQSGGFAKAKEKFLAVVDGAGLIRVQTSGGVQ